ncbi:MAG TPA: hypothetical protein VGR16_10800 [Thermomicrobiales bacterium]|nr:hypothetical protein [Thermomicrobiales bacterium]
MLRDGRSTAVCFVASLIMLLALVSSASSPTAASKALAGPALQVRGGRPMPGAGSLKPGSSVELGPSMDAIIVDRSQGFGVPATDGDRQGVEVRLRERHNSGVSGMATLSVNGDRTVVIVTLEGTLATYPVHVHRGTCDRLDPMPIYPLTDVAPNRASTTTIGTPLRRLLSGEYAINVHQPAHDLESLRDPRNYVACGEITSIGVDPLPGVTPMVGLPTSGTGAAADGSSGQRVAWGGLGILIIAVASGGLLARRGARRP